MATRTAVVTNKPNTADLADKNKRLAYNMYRGMLTQFYPQANAIIESLPHDRVTYDQGVDRHILDMIQQSNQISGGTKRGSNMSEGAMGGGPGVPPPPPPPPPPMPGPGAPMAARPRPPTSSLEPPAAIQVAMMGQSKDKKPFTYTPGGIDLSQIKSPRMARRICRNAANEGICGPPPPPPPTNGQQQGPPPPPMMPPQVAVQVLPPPPPAMPQNRPPPAPQQMRPPMPPSSPQQVRPPPPPQQTQQVRPPPPQQPPRPLAELIKASLPPQSPPSPQPQMQQRPPPMPQVVRAAPAPAPPPPPPQTPQSPIPQQMRSEPVRASPTPTQLHQPPAGTLYIPVVMQQQPQPMQHPPQVQPAPAMLNRTQQCMPWMNSASPSPQSPVPMWSPPVTQPSSRIIPIQVEGRNSPMSPPASKQQANVRVIPIQIEGRSAASPPAANPGVQSPRAGGGHGWASPAPDNPTQSRSFRVLQRITSYDEIEGEPQAAPVTQTGPPPPAPISQMRKLQLSNDDRALMDRFKAQEMKNGFTTGSRPTGRSKEDVYDNTYEFVDVDSSLHTEADPRYRGAAIPSRAFKMLQTMTGPDGNGASASEDYVQVQRAPVQQTRVTSELYVPPSEQSAQPEPRKYTGSAIPSRSFKMLQAMTGTNQDESAGHYSDL